MREPRDDGGGGDDQGETTHAVQSGEPHRGEPRGVDRRGAERKTQHARCRDRTPIEDDLPEAYVREQIAVALCERDTFREREKRHHDHGDEIGRLDRKLE